MFAYKKILANGLPIFWRMIYQNFGEWFTIFLANGLPKFWPLINQNFGH